MRSKSLVGVVACLVFAPSLFLVIAGPASAALSVDAPGWDIVWPGEENTTAVSAFTVGDATGDQVDDVLLSYPVKFDWNDPGRDSQNSFDLFPGSVGGLSPTRLSHTTGVQDFRLADTGAGRAPKDWDYNADGFADMALSSLDFSLGPSLDMTSTMHIWLGSPAGFPSVESCTMGWPSSLAEGYNFAAWLAAGDINGDGPDDVVAIRPRGYATNGTALPTQDVVIAYGASACTNRTFTSPAFTIESEEGGGVTPLGSADFNNDGFDDLVTDESTYGPAGTVHRLRAYPGASSNLSTPGTSFEVTSSVALQLFIGPDVDGDGFQDFSIGAGGSSLAGGENYALVTYRGSRAGLITSSALASQVQGPGYLAAVGSLGDFNGDGLQDLVLARSNITEDTDRLRVEVFLGGPGSFALPADWSSTVQVSGVQPGDSAAVEARGDVDGDGLADIVLLAGANPYGMGPIRDGQQTSSTAQSAVLVFYGRQIVQYLSGVGPVGFDRGVAYPTFEYGFDVTARAASASVFERVSVVTRAGNFSYYPATSTFAFEQNASFSAVEFARVHGSSTASFDNSTQTWDIRFRFEFTWDFSIEDAVTYSLFAGGPSVPPTAPAAPAGSFRVERDIEFAGTLQVADVASGLPMLPGQWAAGGAALHATGLTAHFEGAPSVGVPPSEFTWLGSDDGGASWSQAPGQAELNLFFAADAASDPSDQVAITLSGVPNADVDLPTASFAYRIDADAPTYGAALPANDSWVSTHEVTIAVQVIDPLSGANPSRVEFQTSTAGPSGFGAWQMAAIDGSDLADATAYATGSFLDGDQNYFRFRVYDAVGNGPALSSEFQVRVDTLHVVFQDAAPSADRWQTSPSVVAAVTVRDLGASGVALSSVAYRISNDGLFSYGPWTPVPGLTAGTEIRVQTSVSVAEGDQNFIQWRAEDIVGTGLTVSSSFRILADATAPLFGDLSPAGAERRKSALLDVQVHVSDGGPSGQARSEVDAATIEYAFRAAGGNESEWSREGLRVTNGLNGSWTAAVTVTLAPGPGNEVRFRAADLAGNGPTESAKGSYYLNRAPTVVLSTNATDNTVFVGSNITLKSNISDPDGDRVFFTWYDGVTQLGENNSEEVDVGLPLGNWTLRVVALDAFGLEQVENITVHVVNVPVPPPPPPPPVLPRQVEGDGMGSLLLILAAAAAGVFLFKRYRRGRGGGPSGPA